MKRVGITGGIGSGKSTVAKIFEILNVPVYYADQRGKFLQQENQTVISQIRNTFGDSVFTGELPDPKKLGVLVFAHPDKLAELNSIIHPAVARDFDEWCSRQNAGFVLKEAAIIFETGGDAHLDKTIVVSSPEHLRIARVMERNNLSEAEVRQRMARQWPQERLLEKADFVIRNNEEELLIPQVLKVYEVLSGS